MSRVRQGIGILVATTALLGAGCSAFNADQTTTTTEPSPLTVACAVVADFTAVLDAEDVLVAKLDEAGYTFNPRVNKVIYKEWREAELEAWESVLDDTTAVVVDARGLVETSNPYGSTILEFAKDRRDFYNYVVSTVGGGIIRDDEYRAVKAEYGVVQDRCEEAEQVQRPDA